MKRYGMAVFFVAFGCCFPLLLGKVGYYAMCFDFGIAYGILACVWSDAAKVVQ